MRTKLQPRMMALIGLILLAAMARVIPHPPNFTPIAAIALFGGAQFGSRYLAFTVPLAAMVVSDLMLLALFGFVPFNPLVYFSFALIIGIGMWLRERQSVIMIGGAALASSVLFFLLTNFNAWLQHGQLYPKTWEGLMMSYTAGLPFFTHTLAGDLIYTFLLFGGFALLQQVFPALRQARTVPAMNSV